MKKTTNKFWSVAMIIACLTTTIMFSGCEKTPPLFRVIKASELISLEEAATLLEQSINESEPGNGIFSDEITYRSNDYHLMIILNQEALHDKNSDFEKKLLKDGWKNYLKEMEKNIVPYTTRIEIGSDGTAYLQEGWGFGQWLLYVFSGDYYINLTLGNKSLSYEDTPEEILWKQEKIAESAKLAIKNLKAILK